MKLSKAIEEALITGKYSTRNEFMCSVLAQEYSDKLRDQLQDLLNVIFPGIGKRPLVNALFDREGGWEMNVEDSQIFWENSFKRTSEWYVWFVFDLKRKGL